MNYTIIGCGWLGSLVGTKLLEGGDFVNAIFRNDHKKAELEKRGFNCFKLDSRLKPQISNELTDNTDVLLLMIPPINKEVPNEYGDYLTAIVRQFSHETKIIFTSSTSVYPQLDIVFDETYDLNQLPGKNSIIEAENVLRAHFSDRLTILRLGGLIGHDRHPIRFLTGRTIAKSGSDKISLIHFEDIFRAIKTISEGQYYSKLYNLVYPLQLSKQDYYNVIASKMNMEAPIFTLSKSKSRAIDASKITLETNFNYTFDIQLID